MHFFSMGNLFEEFFESREFSFFCSVKLQENFFHPFASRRKCRCIVCVVKIKIRLERMKIFFQRLIESKKFTYTSAQSFFVIRLSTSRPLVVNKEREETREEEEEEEEEKKEINTLPMS